MVLLLGLVALAATSCFTTSGAAAPEVVKQYSSPGKLSRPPKAPAAAYVAGPLRAPGGPYLYDRLGRVVFLHGVNAVYKLAPFELFPAPGKPWNFSSADAGEIARLGFNVVRLGILWQGLEPGQGGPNQPGVCSSGPPGHRSFIDPAIADAYLANVARTVDLLGRYHIYTLLDMHQDVYNQAFRGEGAPGWAVCTDGRPIFALPGRWSHNYANPLLDIAINHFWDNNVVGNLQGQFDEVWHLVASYFASNPWVVGYDPFNEPFAPGVHLAERQAFAVQLECFYTGRQHPGTIDEGEVRVTCPSTDPAEGVVPTIESADPHHLVFIEPDLFSSRGRPDLLGPMPYPRLVLNVHAYCPDRSPLTGVPYNSATCAAQVLATLLRRQAERPAMTTRQQPGGPPWFLSEFGATQDASLLTRITSYTDLLQVGWAYWAWKLYHDPTGSSAEALVRANGTLGPGAKVLSRAYAQAIAGLPISTSYDPADGSYRLVYSPSRRVRAPTSIFVPLARYRHHGYCASVQNGRIVSPPGSTHLLVDNATSQLEVVVRLEPGRCPRG